MIEKEDSVRASRTDNQRTLARSWQTWSSYANEASHQNGLQPGCFQLRNVFGRAPPFLAHRAIMKSESFQFKLEHRGLNGRAPGLFISGRSRWRTTEGDCNLRDKVISDQLLLGVQHSTQCERGRVGEGNYLAILAFAWAYIRSARWVEMQQSNIETTLDEPKGKGMRYLSTCANWTCGSQRLSSNELEVDLRDLHDDAARWWAAILAPGEGWRAEIKADDIIYRSPWSVCIIATHKFKLRRLGICQQRHKVILTPPSSEMALGFLSDFCTIHHIGTQSSAALAAALHFPYLRGRIATLPLPRPLPHRESKIQPTNAMPSSEPSSTSAIPQMMESFSAESKLLPYYMTLSCNTRGIEALLYGAIFDPQVSCNLVSSWIEPIFEVLDPLVAKSDYKTLTIIMGKRQPKLAALWTGAFISGVAKNIFQHVRIGLLAAEIHSSAWTGTVHSFISLKPTPSVGTAAEISRSDESRLLFLTQCDEHCRLPVSPWKPFGATPLCNTVMEVQQHARCTGHYLQYKNWSWDLIDGTSLEDQGFMMGAQYRETCAAIVDVPLSDIEKFGLPKSEELSEYATRSIFRWLRVSGWPQAEQSIYCHSWIASESEGSDDEADDKLDDKLDDVSSADGHPQDASIIKVEDWLGWQETQ